LIENIQRQELNPIEEANAYKRLIESLNLTQDDVARRIGRDRSFITNYLRILKLPTEIQSLLESEKLTFGHARALLGLSEDVILQRRFAQKIVKHNWSVRETERRIKHAFQENRQKANVSLPNPDPNVRSAEVKLRRYLGTQVRILPAKPGSPGKIEIEYYSDSDLNRIYNAILSKNDLVGANPAAASATG
jgi:ParB family chromosome partitioning protein